ncbi:hypothetical protein FRC14_006699 [Serendipita sp. 396]|nr:hypothetical protein FRC14_006699 [Serendipita sp. 396]
MSEQDYLQRIIPTPATPKAPLAPGLWPGATASSAKEVARLLRENHVKFHCFFNDEGFHNHLAHHLLAAYALGCSESLLKPAYDLHAEYQRPKKESSELITDQNWTKYLGRHGYYPGYLEFFESQILQNGMADCLEKYVFSTEANQPGVEMFGRFFSGLVHPMIHFGHGAEFELPGLAAEGLAMTALTKNMCGGLFKPSFFTQETPADPQLHALSVAARILKDPELGYGKGADPNSNARFQDAIKRSGERLSTYFRQWSPEGSFEAKHEELVWLVSALYGFSGWRKDEEFKANFFTLHLVTSSLFISSIHTLLPPKSQALLLRGFLATALTYWVGHGRRDFTIQDFFAEDVHALVTPPHTDPKPAEDALDATHLHQNPWFAILQSALNHPDEHLLKIQRSFAHYAALYGTKEKGCLAQTELLEAADIDGTLFLRLASLTGKAKAWVREGEPSHDAQWNRRY